MTGEPGRRRVSGWYLLFVVQCLVILWPPLYNKSEPAFMGLPFFYWFQLAWVIVSALLTAVVFVFAGDRRGPRVGDRA